MMRRISKSWNSREISRQSDEEELMAIEIKNIKKKFKNNLVLDGIDLTIEKGDVIGIIGPSGTGKSTLLRSINRLVKPESGSIVLSDGNEIDLVTAKEKDLLTLNQFTGMVFQNFNLFNWKTALENVMEGLLVVKKMDKEQARETALKRLADVGLFDWQNHYPKHLSGGQQQRVAIARTLALNPKIILLDEPISALDVSMREVMKKELKDIQRRFHSTMIFITHEQEEAFYLSDRIMVMSEGNIEQIDTPQTIYHHPANRYIQSFVNAHLDGKLESLCKCTGKQVYEQ